LPLNRSSLRALPQRDSCLQVIDLGCKAVYLEKPGAPTVAELEVMRAYANEKGVAVYMGYNKNVTPYVRKALEAAKAAPGSVTTYVHNNAYKEEELPECFERNAEGAARPNATPRKLNCRRRQPRERRDPRTAAR